MDENESVFFVLVTVERQGFIGLDLFIRFSSLLEYLNFTTFSNLVRSVFFHPFATEKYATYSIKRSRQTLFVEKKHFSRTKSREIIRIDRLLDGVL